jgi:CRP/FNR family cyclic AMP-dependent transcriptional regulator
MTDVAELLGQSAIFGGLPRTVLGAIAVAMRPETYEPGQVIFSRAEPGSGLYLVTSGRVRLSVTSADGRELTFRFAEAGDVMGEIAALDQGPRTADAVAVTRVGAHMLSVGALTRLTEEHPAMLRTALQFVCSRLRDTTNQLEEIALYPIERRVARFLVSALQLGRHDLSAPDVAIDLGMSQTELALLLGASRPKVNVALGALAQARAITRKGDSILCHPAVLLPYARMEG